MTDEQHLAETFKEFAYVVSHDLGQPVRAMVEFSRLLKEEHGSAQDSKLYLSMITENGEKLQAMLAGLLEYSRLNTMAAPFAETDCNQIMRQCQNELAGKIMASNAKLALDPLPVVQADTEQLKRLLFAVLDNALTFYASGTIPKITVSATYKKKDWVFTVRDNGIGIDPRFHERIFHPFKRLHADGEYPGVGMGLTLAKKVVDRHGGNIWVDSQPGRGAAFIFSIPDRKVA